MQDQEKINKKNFFRASFISLSHMSFYGRHLFTISRIWTFLAGIGAIVAPLIIKEAKGTLTGPRFGPSQK
jgi:hypothetical protein